MISKISSHNKNRRKALSREEKVTFRYRRNNHYVTVLTYYTNEIGIILMKLANIVRGDIEVAVTEIIGEVAACKIHGTVLTSCISTGSSCTDYGIGVGVVYMIDTKVNAFICTRTRHP